MTQARRSPAAKTPATSKRSPAAKAPATRKRTATAPRPAGKVDKTKELSEEVLDSLEKGQRAAIEAVRNFSTLSTMRCQRYPTTRAQPSARRSSTPPSRWPTGWSTRSTSSSTR